MKTLKIISVTVMAGIVLGVGRPVQAALAVTDFSNGGSGDVYTASGSGSQVIPDNSPVGVAYSLNFGATGLNISDISVTLNISGGYNGDLTAYLANGSGLAYFLEANPEVSSSGFDNVTLTYGATEAIPTGNNGGVSLSGAYLPSSSLAIFDGSDPNGNWTLFFADLSPGDTSTLTGFSVNFDVMPVPEPTTLALIVFAALLGVGGLGKHILGKCKR